MTHILRGSAKMTSSSQEEKTYSPFEEKPYVFKPLTKQTFKNLVGLTRVNYYLVVRHLLNVKEGEEVPKVTIKSTKNFKYIKPCLMAYVHV